MDLLLNLIPKILLTGVLMNRQDLGSFLPFFSILILMRSQLDQLVMLISLGRQMVLLMLWPRQGSIILVSFLPGGSLLCFFLCLSAPCPVLFFYSLLFFFGIFC
ncbi:hypothetical protein REPUB_Repub10bG0176000 [Reevesia pubescens]